jgi:hypothetical protein
MSDGSEFTPTHRKSTVDGSIVVDEGLPPAPTKLYEWAGEAVAPTEVTVSATSNVGPVEKKGSFDVRTRVGADPAWDRPLFPAEPPAPTYVTGAPLSAEYPGIVPTDAGYQADEGSLGLTIFEYPDPKLKRAAAGPDKGLMFLRIPNWVPDPRHGGAPAGIYLEQSLKSTDPFYLRQTGPDPADKKQTPYCGPTEMAALSSLLARHEALHWTRAHADASAVQSAFHDTLEGFYRLPGVSVSDIIVALRATYKPYASAQTSAVNVVETTLPVQTNAPVCVMRP